MFRPHQESFIFAVNMPTLEEDLEVIKQFYKGTPIELMGVWEGKQERCYQILFDDVLDTREMLGILKQHKQEAIMYIMPDEFNQVMIHDISTAHNRRSLEPSLKQIEKPLTPSDCNYTYCPTTDTYWSTQ